MRLHVHEWGDRDAPPLVALHGVTAHGRRFQRLAEERLASRFRVLAPDLRGHGRSDWEPPWTIATHVADVLETLDAFGVSRPDWLGHSFGGRLLLELAVRAPERLGRVALLDPAIQVLPHIAFDFAELERAERIFTSSEQAVDVWAASAPSTPRAAIEADVAEHLEQLERLSESRLRDELEREMRLAVGQAAANGRPDARCEGRVDDVHVEADVDESGAGDVRQRLAYRALDADPVDVAHREDLRVEMPAEPPFPRGERAPSAARPP